MNRKPIFPHGYICHCKFICPLCWRGEERCDQTWRGMEAERHMLIRRERAQNVRTVGGAEQKKKHRYDIWERQTEKKRTWRMYFWKHWCHRGKSWNSNLWIKGNISQVQIDFRSDCIVSRESAVFYSHAKSAHFNLNVKGLIEISRATWFDRNM